MTAADSIAAEIAARLGTDVVAQPATAARLAGAAGIESAAVTVLTPGSADAIAEALALCSAEGWNVLPVGAASHGPELRRRRWPDDRDPAVIISTLRLDGVTEHEPADLVIGVRAGLPIDRLHETLGRTRQWLPLDPPADDAATIGGIVASGSAGPLRAGHGTPRDITLGLEVATGDGRLLRFGGRVVKNVAGYDGVRMLVGSRGSLGIITAAFLRLRGAPPEDATFVVTVGTDTEDAATAALEVRDAVACDALELLSPGLAAEILPTATPGWHLLVRLTGNASGVREAAARLPSGARRLDGADAKRTWRDLGRLEAGAAGVPADAEPAGAAGGRTVRGLPSELPLTLSSALAYGGVCAAHAADGIVRVWGTGMDESAGTGNRNQVRDVVQRLRLAFDPAGILPEVG